ncbi:MAG: response regulator, partial [Gammaproteobacteria bacterium]|nr:response regulator [Gammaproteobacteria bacterium]
MDATQTKDILIIDIDPESQKAFNRFFVEKGYKPRYAKDEQTAIAAINSKPLALVIIDILTPGLSGLKSLQNVVVNAKRKNTQTVVVTKYSKTEVVSKCVGLGATDYIVKPIENASFTQRIGKL